MIQGHGGVLDRFDSYLFGGVAFFATLHLPREFCCRSCSPMTRKRVAILGSTGSIGTQALDVIARHPDGSRSSGWRRAATSSCLPSRRARFDVARHEHGRRTARGPAARCGRERTRTSFLAATDGSVAFEAVFAAVERGIDVAVANKELIVAAGELLVAAARRSGAQLLPVDSEHSAIFQCLVGEDAVERRGDRADGVGRPVLAHARAKRWSEPTSRRRSRIRRGAWERRTRSTRRR